MRPPSALSRWLSCGPVCVVCLSLLAPTPRARADDWLGRDKALHFSISLALGAGGYGASSWVLPRPWQRAVAGASFSLALGGAKELYDYAGHGDPSWRDFTWDLGGTLTGVALAYAIDRLVHYQRTHARDTARTEAPHPAAFAL